MKNLDIRMTVSEEGLRYKEIANEMHISREWLSRLLRHDLSAENKLRIMRAISSLKEGKAND